MITVRVDGVTLRLDDLPLGEVERLEGAVKVRQVAALLSHAGYDPNRMRWADLDLKGDADDDLPHIYNNGMPTAGGRPGDPYVVLFGRPPYCWPPLLTRAQPLRDLELIRASLEAG